MCGSEDHSPGASLGGNCSRTDSHLGIAASLCVSSGFHRSAEFCDGITKNFVNDILILCAALYLHFLLLDLDQALDNQLLQKDRIVGGFRNIGQLSRAILFQFLRKCFMRKYTRDWYVSTSRSSSLDFIFFTLAAPTAADRALSHRGYHHYETQSSSEMLTLFAELQDPSLFEWTLLGFWAFRCAQASASQDWSHAPSNRIWRSSFPYHALRTSFTLIRISLTFSCASCMMKFTICLICRLVSAILAIGRAEGCWTWAAMYGRASGALCHRSAQLWRSSMLLLLLRYMCCSVCVFWGLLSCESCSFCSSPALYRCYAATQLTSLPTYFHVPEV